MQDSNIKAVNLTRTPLKLQQTANSFYPFYVDARPARVSAWTHFSRAWRGPDKWSQKSDDVRDSRRGAAMELIKNYDLVYPSPTPITLLFHSFKKCGIQSCSHFLSFLLLLFSLSCQSLYGIVCAYIPHPGWINYEGIERASICSIRTRKFGICACAPVPKKGHRISAI